MSNPRFAPLTADVLRQAIEDVERPTETEIELHFWPVRILTVDRPAAAVGTVGELLTKLSGVTGHVAWGGSTRRWFPTKVNRDGELILIEVQPEEHVNVQSEEITELGTAQFLS